MSPRSLACAASWFDGLERIGTQALMDILGVRRCNRSTAQPKTDMMVRGVERTLSACARTSALTRGLTFVASLVISKTALHKPIC